MYSYFIFLKVFTLIRVDILSNYDLLSLTEILLRLIHWLIESCGVTYATNSIYEIIYVFAKTLFLFLLDGVKNKETVNINGQLNLRQSKNFVRKSFSTKQLQ